MGTNTITPWHSVPFMDYVQVVEVELRRVGVEFMQDDKVTMAEIAAGQESLFTPFTCAKLIKLRLEKENDATNDAEHKDSQG